MSVPSSPPGPVPGCGAPRARRAGGAVPGVAPAAFLVLAALGTACAPPDRPAALPPPLSDELLSFLAPDTVRTVRIADGAVYRYLWSPRGPWAVHLVRVDLSRCALTLRVVPAADGADAGGRARVSELVGGLDGRVVAAVNGDFFTREGTPVGPELSAAGLRSPGRRPAFAWSPTAGPWVGTTDAGPDTLLRAGGVAVLAADAGGTPRPRGVGVVVAGFPELLDRGRPVGDLERAARPSFAAARHPRTGVGFSPDGPVLWLAVVDGRRLPYSAGMTLPEMADLFRGLGAEEALNLDGGGSSVLVVGHRAVSRPSDESGERPVVNALVVVEDDGGCRG